MRGNNFAKGRTQMENVKAVLHDILGHGNENCLLPGQPEARAGELSKKYGGLLFTAAEIDEFNHLARQVHDPAWILADFKSVQSNFHFNPNPHTPTMRHSTRKTNPSCKYDMLALGEIMLRLDPGEGRIRCAREFKVWEGGGEYNVARGLRSCFGLKTAVATAFAENEVGRLLEDFILQGGVDTEFIKWAPFDGVGRTVRNGLNFTERGFGVRGAVGIPDRGHSAASQLKPGDFDWDHIFGNLGARWLHTGGIFAALSDTTPQLVIEAVQKAAAIRHRSSPTT